MAQVSESSASAADAFGSLQARRSSSVRKEAEENTRGKQAQDSKEADKVRISQEARGQGSGSRVDEGKSNVDSLRPDPAKGSSDTRTNQVKPSGAGKKSKVIEQQASDRKNSEVQLREFQTKNEVRIEPQVVSESVNEITRQREKAEAAKEPALEPPSQKIIQSDSSSGSESSRPAGNNIRSEQEGSKKEPPNPVSAQTETGQNIDSLI